MSTLRLVATDLDGTLLRSQPEVSDYTVRVLRRVQDAGAHVVPVTARPLRATMHLAEEFEIRGYAMLTSGARIYDLAGAEVHQQTLDHRRALEFVRALRQAIPGILFACERGDDFAREHGYPLAARLLGQLPPAVDHVVAAAEEWLSSPVLKLMAKHPEMTAEQILEVAHSVGGAGFDLTTTGGAFISVLAEGASKLGALERLCAHLGIARDEVVAFGDWPNDIPMLQWASLGVAPSSAHPEVVAAADEVCAPNDDDGVAKTLERLLDEGRFG